MPTPGLHVKTCYDVCFGDNGTDKKTEAELEMPEILRVAVTEEDARMRWRHFNIPLLSGKNFHLSICTLVYDQSTDVIFLSRLLYLALIVVVGGGAGRFSLS